VTPAAAKKLATYADLAATPPHLVAQLVDGELVTQPRPAAKHARAGMRLGVQLESGYGGGGGDDTGEWVLLFEPELHLGPHVLVPDLAGWRRRRMPELPDVAFFELAPDFCCEILSPSTARLDRTRKLPIYAEHTVSHVWLVDPSLRMLEVFALDGESYRFVSSHTEAEQVRAAPFDTLPLELGRLWAR